MDIGPKMFDRAKFYHDVLDQSVIDQIYNAMAKDDIAEPVMTTLAILEETGIGFEKMKFNKSELQSDTLRVTGNNYFNKGDYKNALQCYNEALAHAPKNGKAMKLAYSNRSALLLKRKAYVECIRDIDRCFSMGCPSEIEKKLMKRRKEANFYVLHKLNIIQSKDNFKMTSGHNRSIPSISSQIKIEINDECEPIVKAVDEIKSGTVLAEEVAYVTALNPIDHYTTCYYCLKITPCLLPCDNCCHCMFCSEDCLTKCNDEYHDIECKLIQMFYFRPVTSLIAKTVIKLKKNANSWQELIANSKQYGIKRIENSSLQESLNAESPYSILTFNDNQPFVYGAMYNSCFECAEIIQCLSKIPSFFPKNTSTVENREAKRALARIMIYLQMYGLPSIVIQPTLINDNNLNLENNVAFYTCLGKLRESCVSNAQIYYLNNKAVLIAKHKIKPGDEISVSGVYSLLYRNLSTQEKRYKLFFETKKLCTCSVCLGSSQRSSTLSEKQKQYCRQINIAHLTLLCDTKVLVCYEEVKKVMNILSNIPHSDEYIKVSVLFEKCLYLLSHASTENIKIS